MHSVGTRRVDGESLADQGTLARTAALLRGTAAIARESLGRELERDLASQPGVFGLVDDTHAAAAEFSTIR